MKKVNYWLIYTALGVLETVNIEQGGGLIEDPDDEQELRYLFERHVKPEVLTWTLTYQEKLRLSLAHYLRRPDVLDREVLARFQDLDLPQPTDIVAFFRILWESLFPEQDIHAIGLVEVEEVDDPMETNLVRSDRAN